MNKPSALFGSALFLVAAPGTIAGLVPWMITYWRFQPAVFELEWTRLAGAVLIAAGLTPLLDSFARFALQGGGTPAPIAPPERLVVTGFYRHVRNPMYVGVVTMIFGQALLFADARLATWGAFIWLAFHAFVVAYEEPTLKDSFGSEYEAYCRHVPRWRPRLRAWRPTQHA